MTWWWFFAIIQLLKPIGKTTMSILAYTGTKIKHSFNPLSKLLQKLQFKRCVTRAGFKKTKGAPAHEMIEGIINSGLVADNLHMMSTSSAAALMPACESSMYRFMDKESGGSFQQLSMNLAYEAYKQIDNSTFALDFSA